MRPAVVQAAIVLLAHVAAVGCAETSSSCALDRACDVCTMRGECAWCFETGMCQTPEALCSGEIAYRLEQCEESHASEALVSTPIDASDLAAPR